MGYPVRSTATTLGKDGARRTSNELAVPAGTIGTSVNTRSCPTARTRRPSRSPSCRTGGRWPTRPRRGFDVPHEKKTLCKSVVASSARKLKERRCVLHDIRRGRRWASYCFRVEDDLLDDCTRRLGRRWIPRTQLSDSPCTKTIQNVPQAPFTLSHRVPEEPHGRRSEVRSAAREPRLRAARRSALRARVAARRRGAPLRPRGPAPAGKRGAGPCPLKGRRIVIFRCPKNLLLARR